MQLGRTFLLLAPNQKLLEELPINTKYILIEAWFFFTLCCYCPWYCEPLCTQLVYPCVYFSWVIKLQSIENISFFLFNAHASCSVCLSAVVLCCVPQSNSTFLLLFFQSSDTDDLLGSSKDDRTLPIIRYKTLPVLCFVTLGLDSQKIFQKFVTF